MPAFPSIIDLSTVYTLHGFQLVNDNNQPGNASHGDEFGATTVAAGDVNGDGIGDFLVGAPKAEGAGEDPNANVGEVYLIFGTSQGFPPAFNLSTLNGTNGVRLGIPVMPNQGPYAANGVRLGALGDVDGDGYADFIVHGSASERGVDWIVYGAASWSSFHDLRSGSMVYGLARTSPAGNPELLPMQPTVAGIGDFNGDGIADFAVTSQRIGYEAGAGAGGVQHGTATIIFGEAGNRDSINVYGLLAGGPEDGRGFRILGNAYPEVNLAPGGDLDGDGFDDLIVAFPGAGPEGSYEGRVFIYWGHDGPYNDVNGGGEITEIVSPYPSGAPGSTHTWFGRNISTVGDVNGDGRADFAVGDGKAGKAYIVFGNAAGLGASLAVTGLNGANGFTLINLPTSGYADTVIVAPAGDLNHDGIEDLAVGVPVANGLHGQVFVIYGSMAGFPATIDMAALAPDRGFRVDGVMYSGGAFPGWGTSLSGGQDVNGDGIDDLLIGANDSYPGSAAVIYGRAEPTVPVVQTGTAGRDGLWGGTAADRLNGGGGNDELHGLAGDDMLDGGALGDRMLGGTGNDSYRVNHVGINSYYASDTIVEKAGEGYDTVYLDLTGNDPNSWGMGDAEIERVFVYSAGTQVSGNAANTLFDFTYAGGIDAGGGNDVIHMRQGGSAFGGSGDDIFYVYVAGGFSGEMEGGGTDTVNSYVDYALGLATSGNVGFVENLVLLGSAVNATGNPIANMLTGNANANTLDGREGGDRMAGGLGDDIYHVDNAGDRVTEMTNQGTDRVFSSVNFELGANVENLTLTGGDPLSGAGNALANMLTGNDGNNWLVGLAGNDMIYGGLGGDRMEGGANDDSYNVDNTLDRVNEKANEGTDQVYSSITFELTVNVENLTLTGGGDLAGGGNALANVLTGNTGNNWLAGAAGNDRIDGGLGFDRMDGGTGDDSYVVDNSGDRVNEKAGEGTDSVTSSISYELGGNVENLTLSGGVNLNGGGNGLANTMVGNDGANWLTGVAGADLLDGGLGSDRLDGGTGADIFRFSSALGGGNIDAVRDFVVADDTIQLDRTIFVGIAANGVLAAGALRIGSAALDADDRILYDAGTGNLWYDADGVGGAAAVQFAKLTAGLALTNADFFAIP